MTETNTTKGGNPPTRPAARFGLRGRTGQYVSLAIAAALVLASLWLPPVSLGNRWFHWDVPRVSAKEGGSVVHATGARLSIAPGALPDDARVLIEAMDVSGTAQVRPADSVLAESIDSVEAPDSALQEAVSALPATATFYSPFYRVSSFSEPPARATLSIPVPYEIPSLSLVDLYAFDGDSWRWVPATATPDGLAIETEAARVPAIYAIATPESGLQQVGLAVSADEADRLPETGPQVAVTVKGWTLEGPTGVAGQAPARETLAGNPSQVLVSLTNEQEGVVRSDLADNLLIDAAAVEAHVQAIVERVAAQGYDGVELAYMDVNPDLRAEFSAFVTRLANALQEQHKMLAVRLPAPHEDDGTWDTGAYDWQAIGQVADLVRVTLPAEPESYAPGGQVERLLNWAVGNVPRSRLEVVISAYSHDAAEGELQAITYEEGLHLLTENIQVENPAELLLPGQTLRLGIDPGAERILELDPASQVNWFEYQGDDGRSHRVWLENARSMVRKLQAAQTYALRGSVLEGPLAQGNDQSVLSLLATWQQELIPPGPQYTLMWQVQDTEGNVIRRATTTVDDAQFAWVAPERPGLYEISASVSDDGGQTDRGIVAQVDVQIPTPTFTPMPTATPTPMPTATRAPAPAQAEASTASTEEEPAPAATPAAVAAVPAAGRVGGYFGYGIQAHIYGDDAHIYGLIQGMGFNWIKQQVEWSRTEPGSKGNYQWGDLDRIVGGARAAGLNVLLSVVKAPAWARGGGADLSVEGPPANPQDFADFLTALATRYRGQVQAYEVWNEQNLHYEWGNEPISASRYVELLRYSFIAIKNADPNAVVVSGAPTPTGMNDGVIAIDDRAYLEQMYQAGLKNYCDAVGVHPSGYNNPPDADWRTWSDPSAPTFKGHPSFFFRGTMESYRNIMVAYGDAGKRLWPTEFGWSTFENLGSGAPAGYEYANHNTEAEQAQWLVQAFQMSRNWGWVGPMFVWNLNFAPVSGPANEKAGFGILRADWSPRPAYTALQSMAK